MTYQSDYTLSQEVLEHLSEEGLDAIPEMIRVVINAAELDSDGRNYKRRLAHFLDQLRF